MIVRFVYLLLKCLTILVALLFFSLSLLRSWLCVDISCLIWYGCSLGFLNCLLNPNELFVEAFNFTRLIFDYFILFFELCLVLVCYFVKLLFEPYFKFILTVVRQLTVLSHLDFKVRWQGHAMPLPWLDCFLSKLVVFARYEMKLELGSFFEH